MIPAAKRNLQKKAHAPRAGRRPSMVLYAQTALDLMTPNPIAIEEGATIKEAATVLSNKGLSAAPVINAVGRPIGVLSRADLLWFEREMGRKTSAHEYYEALEIGSSSQAKVPGGSLFGRAGDLPVREIMTSMVYAVSPETPLPKVIEEMLDRRVHRLFVVDRAGLLMGVISTLDVIKMLSLPPATTRSGKE